MNAVNSRGHPNVILLGYPLTRATTTNQLKVDNVPSQSFPVLAVTRSNTTPCFPISKRHRSKNTEYELKSSNIINRNHKRSSHNQLHRSTTPDHNVNCDSPEMLAKNDLANRTKPRASSLPVWPVTDPNIIRKFTNDSTTALPKPKVSPNVVIYRPKRRNSACGGLLKHGQPHVGNTKQTRCSIIVSSKQPSRCETPMSEYDPDKLNIKQVVSFLDNHDQNLPHSKKSHLYHEVIDTRPRPFTVAYTGHDTSGLPKSGHHRTKHRKSPPAAKRYMRSAKSSNSVERALSVSSLIMSDKRSANRYSKRAMKMEKLANLAARYNPEIKVNKTDPPSSSPEKFQQVSKHLHGDYFGKLKYDVASFNSFPTNKVEMITENVCKNERADDSDEPDPEAVVFDIGISGIEEKNPMQNSSDGATFNANNAIRLPSVFDNIDTESEVGRKPGFWSMPASFEQLTVSDGSDSLQSDSVVAGPCIRLTSQYNTRDTRHRRNLSMVLSRERSSEISLCAKDDSKMKIKQTRNWVNLSLNDNSKVVELKLTHGLPPHL